MKKWVPFLLTLALLLSGCTAAPSTTVPQLATKPTVEDLFTQPKKTLPAGTGSQNITRPTDATEPTNPNHIVDWGMTGFGGADELLIDDYGGYRLYEGGQMYLPLQLIATGQSAVEYTEYGVGFLLFLGGQPQPYRIGADGELTYCQIIYPEFNLKTNDYIFDVYFTPIMGEAGDTLELYYATILSPNWQTDDPEIYWMYTFGSCYAGSRLKLNEDPPEAPKPNVPERLQSVDIHYEDVLKKEIQGWSDSDLIERYAFQCYVNGTPFNEKNRHYGISEGDTVELRFEVWGTPYVKYGLMFYVDNEPISAEQEIYFDMKNGQKTVITVTLDVRDFDGEWALYGALIPRNCRSTEIRTGAFIDYTSTFFLLGDPEPEK